MTKVYTKFKATQPKDNGWAVVTADDDGIIIAVIPKWIKHPKGVAEALSRSLTDSKFSLVDLI